MQSPLLVLLGLVHSHSLPVGPGQQGSRVSGGLLVRQATKPTLVESRLLEELRAAPVNALRVLNASGLLPAVSSPDCPSLLRLNFNPLREPAGILESGCAAHEGAEGRSCLDIFVRLPGVKLLSKPAPRNSDLVSVGCLPL